MKKLIFTFIIFAAALISQAQNVSNINAVQQGNTIVVFYDLDADANIALTVSLNGGKNFIDLMEVTGDVGNSIKAGKEKKIYWNAMEEIGFTNVEKMIFQVNAVSHSLTAEKEELVYSKGNLCVLNKVEKISESGRKSYEMEYAKLSKGEVLAIMMDNGKSDIYYDYYLKGENQKRNGKLISGGLALGGIIGGTILEGILDESGVIFTAVGVSSICVGGVLWIILNSYGNKKIKKSAVLYNSSKRTSDVYLTPSRSGLGVCINF